MKPNGDYEQDCMKLKIACGMLIIMIILGVVIGLSLMGAR